MSAVSDAWRDGLKSAGTASSCAAQKVAQVVLIHLARERAFVRWSKECSGTALSSFHFTAARTRALPSMVARASLDVSAKQTSAKPAPLVFRLYTHTNAVRSEYAGLLHSSLNFKRKKQRFHTTHAVKVAAEYRG